ncbi:hypothetical protein [Nocardioides sp. SYSU DS0651]|uniref:hypothetical protein n=1 Tax=Nocardioides sp. SYSU DS0651 TaxID=3415955 RepID=UPI003F4B2DD3
MYTVDHPTDAGDTEVGLRALLRENQRRVRPAQVARRRHALRQVLATSLATELPPELPDPCLEQGAAEVC